jgi:hypothetical protein
MTQTPQPDVPMFFTGDVCRAVGVDQVTLKNWIARGAILMSDEDRARLGVEGPSHERLATGSGRSHLFTLRRVVQIALIAELVRLGFSPSKAGVLALGFTDVGKGSIDENGKPAIQRFPGQLHKSGHTLLIAHPDQETSTIINADLNASLHTIFQSGAEGSSAAVVNVSEVCARVCAALDVKYPE